MNAIDIKPMMDKLGLLVGSGYVTEEESNWLQQVLALDILRQEHVERLTAIYNRVYSLKV